MHAGAMDTSRGTGTGPGYLGLPENEVPVGVAVSAVLGRSEQVAVALFGAYAYRSGVSLDIAVRFRTDPSPRRGTRVFELISARHRPASQDELAERLLLGVEFSDGRSATNLDQSWPRHASEDDSTRDTEPLLQPYSGGGGGRRYDQKYFLSPLPPAGPLTVVCTWSAFGLAETHTIVDGSAMAAAGAQVQVLWPWQPEDDEPTQPSEPLVPTTGWFAKATRNRHPDG